jgi:hypothetical protein
MGFWKLDAHRLAPPSATANPAFNTTAVRVLCDIHQSDSPAKSSVILVGTPLMSRLHQGHTRITIRTHIVRKLRQRTRDLFFPEAKVLKSTGSIMQLWVLLRATCITKAWTHVSRHIA